jgi:cyanophycinase
VFLISPPIVRNALAAQQEPGHPGRVRCFTPREARSCASSSFPCCPSSSFRFPAAPTRRPCPGRSAGRWSSAAATCPAARRRFLDLAGGRDAHLVVLATADGAAEAEAVAGWRKQGVASVELLHAADRAAADAADGARPIAGATGVWLTGDSPSRAAAVFRETVVARALEKLLARGGVVGSPTAGGALAALVPVPGGLPGEAVDGLGLLPGAAVEAHVLKRNRLDELLDVLSHHPGHYGLGIDDGTALVLRGRRLTVLGPGYAVTGLAAGAAHPARVGVLHGGAPADLVALYRAARARSQAPFPPAKPEPPDVPHGALMIGGGGGLAPAILKRFIDLAGGPDAPIVVVPTAMEDPVRADPIEAVLLRRAGAKNVSVLHTRDRAEADRPEFVAPLRRAKGVWFGGGRQWHFVDSYEGTLTGKAFHDVLRRGGVIGGSSAGASIQSEYMPRGDPLGNRNIIAEGYERGFGFLKGVAVDQHFFARHREHDMSELMATYPQLLGIGIDEGTVIIVRGHVLEVMGRSKVAVYDRRKPLAPGAKDYEELPAGARYDLQARKRLDEK